MHFLAFPYKQMITIIFLFMMSYTLTTLSFMRGMVRTLPMKVTRINKIILVK